MPRYVEVDAERLSNLHDGLELIEMVDRAAVSNIDLHLYGITNNPQIVDAAKEAIAESEEVAEEDVQLSEVAVAIKLSADIIYYLTGSGLILRREDFAYLGSGGEGVRTMSFAFAHYKPRVPLSYFSKLALASSNGWLDEFLQQEGSGQAAKVTPNVRRTEEATQPTAPAAPAAKPAPNTTAPAAGAPPAAPAQTQPRQSSLRQISKLLDTFLD